MTGVAREYLVIDVFERHSLVEFTYHFPFTLMHGTGERPPTFNALSYACLNVSDGVGMPADGLALLKHPFPLMQIRPVTFTRARSPDMTAPTTLIFPFAVDDDDDASLRLTQDDRWLGGK
jgi:hypothetical protein